MAHKTFVNSTAYEIKGGRTRVNGTGYDIKSGRTLVNGTGYDIKFSSYDPVFANNSWEQIVLACQNNNVPSTWTVGSQKYVDMFGGIYIDIIGKNHDDYFDGSGKAPLTFQLHSLGFIGSMNSTATTIGGWLNCLTRSLESSALKQFPEEIRNNIRAIKKITGPGGTESSGSYEVTSDKLFLLSEIEVFGSVGYSDLYVSEGSQYEYYETNSPIKNNSYGETAYWWLRSPARGLIGFDRTQFCLVHVNGGRSFATANSTYGLAYAFCF